MGDFLKIARNDQILDNTLDRSEANSLDAPQFQTQAGGKDDDAKGLQPGRTAPRGGPVPNSSAYSIEGMHFYTFNQIKYTIRNGPR